MTSVKTIFLNWWNKFLCWLLAHKGDNVCQRCGRLIDLEENDSLLKRLRFKLYRAYSDKPDVYKGSLKNRPGLNIYELDMADNTLRLLEIDVKNLEDGAMQRHAKYNPVCHYIYASNEKNAIRKANNHLRLFKNGIHIKKLNK